jgi:hypothetical protein
MKRVVCLFAMILISTGALAGDITNQFITARLAHGLTVSIPRSWQVMHGREMQAIESSVGATIDLSGYSRIVDGTETLLVANFQDPSYYAAISVTSTAAPGVTPALPSMLNDDQIKAGENTARQVITAIQTRMGVKVWGWTPMKKQSIGSRAVMYMSYLRSSDFGDSRVHMYKFFGDGRIHDIALSTRVSQERINGPVLEKIVQSVALGS